METAASSSSSHSSLADLRPGQAGVIVGLDLSSGTGRRLAALGFVPGSTVSVRRVAPLLDPVEYCVRGTCVSLRRTESASIRVRIDRP